MSLALLGIGVSRGIVIGRVQHVLGGHADVPEHHITDDSIEAEINRFESARQAAHTDLNKVRDAIPPGAPADIAGFIDSHILMLDDSSLSDGVIQHIREQKVNAEWALSMQRDALVNIFEQMQDPYLRARSDDVDHVVGSILRILLNEQRDLSTPVETDLPRVIVADDVSPAELVTLNHTGVGAILTEFGGPLSHASILARSFGVPMIVGLRNSRQLLQDDELIIVDGQQGQVIAGPEDSAVDYYLEKQVDDQAYRKRLQLLANQPSNTQDDHPIQLKANIEFFEDIAQADSANAAGVGLYRTEFLYMNHASEPTEEEQFDVYSRVITAMHGRPITVRTLDIGADKQLEAERFKSEANVGNNPALGLRGIRLCLQQPSLFKPQLRALLRASARGPIQIMLPMVSNIEEIRATKDLIAQLKVELDREGHTYDNHIPIGAMIEVPSAAVTADLLAQETDFLSIGTNDLIQYTVAIDRVDDTVNYLYDPLHAGVLRLIKMTIDAGANHNIPVSMCGEMAGMPRYTRLLLALGLTEFSMHPTSLLEVKEAVINTHRSDSKAIAEQICSAAGQKEATQLLDKLNRL